MGGVDQRQCVKARAVISEPLRSAARDSAHLDPTVGFPGVERGLTDGGGAPQECAVTDVELRAVAGAGDDMPVELTVAEETAAVATAVMNRVSASP